MAEILMDKIEDAVRIRAHEDPYYWIRDATDDHRRDHGCGAYPFADGTILGAVGTAVEPGSVLELGTALGYTACWWGLTAQHVDTIENDSLHVSLARQNIERAGLADRVTVHEGKFDTVMRQLNRTYDLAFFDGFEPSGAILRQMMRLVCHGGLLVTTNLHFGGMGAFRDAVIRSSTWRTRFVDANLAISTPG